MYDIVFDGIFFISLDNNKKNKEYYNKTALIYASDKCQQEIIKLYEMIFDTNFNNTALNRASRSEYYGKATKNYNNYILFLLKQNNNNLENWIFGE